MQKRLKICKWRIAVWLLIVCCVQPTRAVTYANPYVGSTRVGSSVVQTTAPSVSAPGYEFQSTSIFAPTTGTPKIDFVPLADGARPFYTRPGLKRDGLPGQDGQEIGVVPTPVGEPLVLLLFAMLYVVSRLFRRAKE